MNKSDKTKSDNLFVYVLASKLIKPFKQWDLFKEGKIDHKGKILSENNEVSQFDKFLIYVKNMVNESHLATYITFMKKDRSDYLTKEKIMEQYDRHSKFDKIENKILSVFAEHKVTKDDYFNYLLEKLKYDKSIISETVKQGEILKGGDGDGRDIEEFNPYEVVKGLKVEMEHSNNIHEVIEIVVDHLSSSETYYSDMESFEKQEHEKEDI